MDRFGGIPWILTINVVLFTAFIVPFLLLWRPRNPNVYFPKKKHLPLWHKKISWLKEVFLVADNNLYADGGLLGLLYVKFQRVMLIYCVVVTVIAVCVMLPINLTGEGETPGEFGFAHSTGTNIVPRSWRLWVYAAVATFVSAMAYMCIVWYQHEFFETKKKYAPKLGSEGVNRHTVKLRNISKDYSEDDVSKIIASAGYDVAAVHLAYESPTIHKLQRKKKKVQSKLERAEYIQQTRLRDQVCDTTSLKAQLIRLSTEISAAQETDLKPTGVAFVSFHHAADASDFVYHNDGERKDKTSQVSSQPPILRRLKNSILGIIRFFASDSVRRPSEADPEALLKGDHDCSTVMECGVIPSKWSLKIAAKPSEILWTNLSYGRRAQALRKCGVYFLVILIAFFWAIPIVILTSLSSLTAVRFVGPLVESVFGVPGPWELLVQEFLPPLLILVIDTYIPHLLRYLTTFEKPHSQASLDTSVMKKYFVFVLLNNLVFPSFITGGLSAILLGTSNSQVGIQYVDFAIQGAFFISYLIQAALLGRLLSILRVYDLLRRRILRSRAVTPKEVEQAEVFPVFRFFVYFGDTIIGVGILFWYAEIVPLVCPFACLYLVVRIGIDGTLIIASKPPSENNDGRMISSVCMCFLCVVMFGQVFILGFLLLKLAPPLAVLLVFSLPFATGAVMIVVLKRFNIESKSFQRSEDMRATDAPIEEAVLRTAFVAPVARPEGGTVEYTKGLSV